MNLSNCNQLMPPSYSPKNDHDLPSADYNKVSKDE